ncbi:MULTISPECIES: hypothetical protein [unclassified Cryobacterium]|uniref:hypothetical protein n=1 Tax=unclassified Cryobacterium TaxID=2649013 RepID=UPI00106C145E|nr:MULTISPECIES: hypothetical protein [unclassified Cryobacterium]TFC56061.1 hypothetical protein E3O68_04540 [Cryobacterium sp. TMB3-1-2]TFC62699.1 hypothetical protein E3O60_02355 [Cryobacterium sp. TMB1-7]TFC69705.1 hypothetical protein E3T21_11965 [Cryobacterium sp. TMB3-15]TFC78071.1 hypothetical protein E3T22_04450 [Cryobacterium sp. TMB3-10]TFD39479.1 hypothetical protein E3T58_15285 [Cryobacterium sp. TMB3-12]
MVIVGGGRRGVGRMASAACVGGLLLGAAGCTAAPKPAPPSPTPTITPIFASDEEALAAATEAYANYLKLSVVIAHEGGNNSSRMEGVAVGEALETEIHALEGMLEAGTAGVGVLKFDTLTMQSADLATGELSAYVCLDVSESDVVDSAGVSVVSVDRVERLPLEIGFVFEPATQRLLLERTRSWDGENFCSSL